MASATQEQPTLFGHPTGLYTLFFAEMWERFSYYGMRALLIFYMTKGFLGLGDKEAYKVYGAYVAMVYMTPFFGGMIADRLLGQRRAVVLGGLLMAAGHLLMTIEAELPFYCALALLIVGNGFFKPNISTIVGSLYGDGDARRDGGFTVFYIGINLGAAMAPLLCGYVGETFGWHYGFGLATIGMLIGLAVFVVPTRLAQFLILGGGLLTAFGQVYLQDSALLLAVNGLVALALVVSSISAFAALNRGGLPADAGGAPDPEALDRPFFGVRAEHAVYIGSVLFVPLFAALVWSNLHYQLISPEFIKPLAEAGGLQNVAATFLTELSTPAGLILMVIGSGCFLYIFRESLRMDLVGKQRLWVALTMMSFSALFWAFFEQAGSSINNFTDRNVDLVREERVIAASEVGSELAFRVPFAAAVPAHEDLPVLGQEQLGYDLGGAPFTMSRLTYIRTAHDMLGKARSAAAGSADAGLLAAVAELDALAVASVGVTGDFDGATEHLRATAEKVEQLAEGAAGAGTGKAEPIDHTVQWRVTDAHVGMGVGGSTVPASTFQSANPIYILLFGLVFSWLWGFLGRRGLEPSTPVKFALGLFQLGLGFIVLWYGAQAADDRGMVLMSYLLLGYLLHTTGELCLSPVGLSMVTKLSPKRLVATVMGAWFLATAFSGLIAAIIATFTGAEHGGGDSSGIPVPAESLHVYGDVFGTIGLAAIAASVVALGLSPVLRRWMHEDVGTEPAAA